MDAHFGISFGGESRKKQVAEKRRWTQKLINHKILLKDRSKFITLKVAAGFKTGVSASLIRVKK
jgi:ribosomal protein L28